jgi:hypothetical protein
MKSKVLLCRLFTLSLVLALTVVFGNGELTTFPGFPECATAQAAVDSVPAESEGSAGGHGDPYALVFDIFAFLLLAAMAGRYAANKLKQSPVLGELLVGILLGAILYQIGNPVVTTLRHFKEIEQTSQKVLKYSIGWQQALNDTLEKTKFSSSTEDKIKKVGLSPDFPLYVFLAQVLLLFSSLGVIML